MYSLRHNDATGPSPKAVANSVWRMENITTPQLAEEEGYILPNCSTVYGFGFLDLKREPIILTLPDSDGRYYLVQCVDMWTNAFAYPAGKTAGYKGSKVALVGPGWKGKLPDSVKRMPDAVDFDSAAPSSYGQRRRPPRREESAVGHHDSRAVRVHRKARTAAAQVRLPSPGQESPKFLSARSISRIRSSFGTSFPNALNENPPPKAQIDGLLPLFKPLGIELGKKWDRNKVDPIVLSAMKRSQRVSPH